MNCQMADVTVTLRDGRTHTLDNVFVRGSQVKRSDIALENPSNMIFFQVH